MLYKISYIRFASVFICLAWTTVQRSSKYLFVHLEGQLLEFFFICHKILDTVRISLARTTPQSPRLLQRHRCRYLQ